MLYHNALDKTAFLNAKTELIYVIIKKIICYLRINMFNKVCMYINLARKFMS